MKQIKLMLEDRLKVFIDKGFSYNIMRLGKELEFIYSI